MLLHVCLLYEHPYDHLCEHLYEQQRGIRDVASERAARTVRTARHLACLRCPSRQVFKKVFVKVFVNCVRKRKKEEHIYIYIYIYR